MKNNEMRKAKAVYAELDIAKEPATITCILAETERLKEEWESLLGEKKEGIRWCPEWKFLAGEVVGDN